MYAFWIPPMESTDFAYIRKSPKLDASSMAHTGNPRALDNYNYNPDCGWVCSANPGLHCAAFANPGHEPGFKSQDHPKPEILTQKDP